MLPTNELNIAGRIAQFFITSRLTVIFILAVAIIGTLAILQTPREENPQISMPGAVVRISLPGAPAKEIEDLVLRPLEQTISELDGIDHVYGTAQDSIATVQVIFKVGESKERSLVKLYDRLLSNATKFPSDATLPQVSSIDVDDVPLYTATLSSAVYDDFSLKRFAERITEHLHSIENVSVVKIYGGRDREISVELNPERLQAFGITFDQVLTAFSKANLSTNLTPVVEQNKIKSIRVDGQLSTISQVGQLIISVNNRRPIYLRDIASLHDGPHPELSRYSQFAFGPASVHYQKNGQKTLSAVTIAVSKKKGANAVSVTKSVTKRIEELKNKILPKDVYLTITRDDGQTANDAVNLLMEHLVISILSVGLIILIFLGWRDALIVMITIPLILAVTLAVVYFGNITINRVTLFSLILSLGLMVDAAIVVVENIKRHYLKHCDSSKINITIQATNEIGNPTNLATIAVILAFSSLYLVTDMAGAYFYPIAYTVPVAMTASILVAYIVTPWGAYRWLNCHQPASPGSNAHQNKYSMLENSFVRLLSPLQNTKRKRIYFFMMVILLVILSSLQGTWHFIRPSGIGGPPSLLSVPLGFLPKDNKNTFNIVIWMPIDTAPEQTDRLVRDINNLFKKVPDVINWQNWVGQAGVPDFNGTFKGIATRKGGSVAEIRVNLKDKSTRKSSSIIIVKKLRKDINTILKNYPGARINLVEDPPGPPVRSTVEAEIYGPNDEGLRYLSSLVEKEFRKTWDMVDFTSSEQDDISQYSLVPDAEKAALSNVSVEKITDILKLVYSGEDVGRLHPTDEKQSVNVRAYVPRRWQLNPETLHGIYVNNVMGDAVPLSELVKVNNTKSSRQILHKDNERVTFVGGELADSAALYAVLDLNNRLKSLTTPENTPLQTGNLSFSKQTPDVTRGYNVFWGGEMRMTLDVYRDMAIALSGALILVYLLLVTYYQSFSIPMIAMAAVPLGIIGIFPGHWITGVQFSATSMVGIIALSGVVIRNSLLIIDFTRENIHQGTQFNLAIRQGAAIRLRPILLTTLAIIFGSAIMLSDPVFGGLAVSLIFGTLSSTLLTVFVIPLLCQFMGSKRLK